MEYSRIVFLAIALLLPFSVFPASAATMGPTVLTREDNGKEITLTKGSVFVVELGFSAGTGFSWEIVHIDDKRLNLLDSGTKQAAKESLPGGPMLKSFHFKAVGTGRTALKFSLYRSWEGPAKAAETFAVKITVK
ncbi:MAG: protease inhibitor I42 family protein [Desulfobacteraceae bacterium]|nr:protease inhibitor I42 family protein [Desulfobacteraceae bacterium]